MNSNVYGSELPRTITLVNNTGRHLPNPYSLHKPIEPGKTFDVCELVYNLMYANSPLTPLADAAPSQNIPNKEDRGQESTAPPEDSKTDDKTSLRDAVDTMDVKAIRRILKERGVSVPRKRQEVLNAANKLLAEDGE